MHRLRALCIALAGTVAATPALAEVRLYDVAPQHRQEVRRALEVLLDVEAAPQRSPKGTVAVLPTGQIAVDTSPERQAEIEMLFEAVQRADAGATPSVSLRYWVIFGSRNGTDTQLPPLLEPVVNELRPALGDLSFEVIDTASLITESGSSSSSNSETMEIAQVVQVNGSTLNATIHLETEYQEFAVEVTLEEGEYLVLGDSTAQTESGQTGSMIYVVHWPIRD